MNISVQTDKPNVGFLRLETDAMSPTFRAGDYIAVEQGDFTGDGIYAIEIGGVVQVKRLMWMPQGFLVINDNKAYPSYPARVQDVDVIGRVGSACKML